MYNIFYSEKTEGEIMMINPLRQNFSYIQENTEIYCGGTLESNISNFMSCVQ